MEEQETAIDHPEFDDNFEGRPQFLTALCVLTWIWNGMMSLLALIIMALAGPVFELIRSGEVPMEAGQKEQMDQILDLGDGVLIAIFGVFLAFSMIQIVAAWFMWKQRKLGFYIYVGANTLLLAGYFTGGSWFLGSITVGFIGMYAANLKAMR